MNAFFTVNPMSSSFGILSLVPVGISLVVMVLSRKVALGLFLGALAGFLLFMVLSPNSPELALFTKEHCAVLFFTILMGCLGGHLQKSGAFKAFYAWTKNAIHDRCSAQLMACSLVVPSILNELEVGLFSSSTLRSRFDSLKFSRAKLSFLTEAPSSIAPSLTGMSILMAFLMSLMTSALNSTGTRMDAHRLILASIPYQFYAWFYFFTVLVIAISGRDFGPMVQAERKSFKDSVKTHPILKEKVDIPRLLLFFGSIVVFLIGIFLVLLVSDISGSTNGYMAMPVAASLAFFFAIFFSLFNRQTNPQKLIAGCAQGLSNVAPIMLIMLMAWAFGQSLEHLGTAHFLVKSLFHNVDIILMPMFTFALAAILSMAIGINFGALAVIIPITIPAVMMMGDQTILLATIASIMGGAIFGGHCSELYENTIQSAMGSRVDIFTHMRCKLPYALLSAFLSIIVSLLLLALSMPILWSLPLGFLATLLIFFCVGKRLSIFHHVEEPKPT